MNMRVYFVSNHSIVFILAALCYIAEIHCYMNNKTASMCCNFYDYTKVGMVANCGTPTDDKMKGSMIFYSITALQPRFTVC